MNRGPERRTELVKTANRYFIFKIHAADDVHPGIRHVREVVELCSHQVWHVADRARRAQCPDDCSAEGAGAAGDDDMAAGKIDHLNIPAI